MTVVASPTLVGTSRVWIYQSNRPFPENEISNIQERLNKFCKDWQSHRKDLIAHGEILHNRFIILTVDERKAKASGCAIDESVRFMQGLEREYGVDLFDRMNFAYMDGETIKTAYRDEFIRLYKRGTINDNTLVFNNLVRTRADFEQNWKVQLKDTWHARLVK